MTTRRKSGAATAIDGNGMSNLTMRVTAYASGPRSTGRIAPNNPIETRLRRTYHRTFHTPHMFGTTAIGNTMTRSIGTGTLQTYLANVNAVIATSRKTVGIVMPAMYARRYGC